MKQRLEPPFMHRLALTDSPCAKPVHYGHRHAMSIDYSGALCGTDEWHNWTTDPDEVTCPVCRSEQEWPGNLSKLVA